MAKILVRVKPGMNVRESGAGWTSGQTFWIDESRFKDVADTVDKVTGVEPKIFTGAMDEPVHLKPESTSKLTGIPVPELRQPREPEAEVMVEPDPPPKKSATADDDSAEFIKTPETKKTLVKKPAVKKSKITGAKKK